MSVALPSESGALAGTGSTCGSSDLQRRHWPSSLAGLTQRPQPGSGVQQTQSVFSPASDQYTEDLMSRRQMSSGFMAHAANQGVLCHLGDVLAGVGMAESAGICKTRIMTKADKVESDAWSTWHVESWGQARTRPPKREANPPPPPSWRAHCAVSAFLRAVPLAQLSAALRWRSAVGETMLKQLVGGQVGP